MFIVVANWKAQLTFDQTITFCQNNLPGFDELSCTKGIELVICPSFEAIDAVAQLFQDTALHIGAQNCSAYKQGAYTGQVTAASLAEAGCTYCIIGHYESRTYLRETDLEIADKAQRLLEVGIEPICCIGETQQEYENKLTFQALSRQLDPLVEKLAHNELEASNQTPLCIAYEPIWAIGSGKSANPEQLAEIFAWLSANYSLALLGYTVRFLYGGSVTAQTVSTIKKIPGINGILVGSASLDFKNFEKIVSFYS